MEVFINFYDDIIYYCNGNFLLIYLLWWPLNFTVVKHRFKKNIDASIDLFVHSLMISWTMAFGKKKKKKKKKKSIKKYLTEVKSNLWWKLFQKRVMRTKIDIYVFICHTYVQDRQFNCRQKRANYLHTTQKSQIRAGQIIQWPTEKS